MFQTQTKMTADQIKALRHDLGMTYDEFARRFNGGNSGATYLLESGQRPARGSTLIMLERLREEADGGRKAPPVGTLPQAFTPDMVRRLREWLVMGQPEFGALLGVGFTVVSKMEAGKLDCSRGPKLLLLRELWANAEKSGKFR